MGRALLAVQEALVNAVEHGSLPGAPIDVDVAVDGRRARVRVRGGRPGSASPSGPPAAPLPSQAHGRGRMIMKALAQRYDTRSSGAGTLVELVFARAHPERAGRPTGLDQLRQDLRAA